MDGLRTTADLLRKISHCAMLFLDADLGLRLCYRLFYEVEFGCGIEAHELLFDLQLFT